MITNNNANVTLISLQTVFATTTIRGQDTQQQRMNWLWIALNADKLRCDKIQTPSVSWYCNHRVLQHTHNSLLKIRLRLEPGLVLRITQLIDDTRKQTIHAKLPRLPTISSAASKFHFQTSQQHIHTLWKNLRFFFIRQTVTSVLNRPTTTVVYATDIMLSPVKHLQHRWAARVYTVLCGS